MRHMKAGRKLGRNSSHRKALYRNMVTALLEHGRIRTTDAKAREIRPIAEKVISLGKRIPPSKLLNLVGEELDQAKAQRVHAIRLARRLVNGRTALDRLFNEYAERFQDRPGGYTRILKVGPRPGDNAPMALIELVDSPEELGGGEEETSAPETAAQDTAQAEV